MSGLYNDNVLNVLYRNHLIEKKLQNIFVRVY